MDIEVRRELSSPKKQKRDTESKHELEEIKKDNIEAEKRQKSRSTQKKIRTRGEQYHIRSASLFISQKLAL
ncbi:MAG: hypothetical protein M3P08_05480 [Thermoproteota archaeon]|nr:hypothetical protein [Thermoproteota archaeon]